MCGGGRARRRLDGTPSARPESRAGRSQQAVSATATRKSSAVRHVRRVALATSARRVRRACGRRWPARRNLPTAGGSDRASRPDRYPTGRPRADDVDEGLTVTCGDSAADDGTRGPWMAITSSISTSRRVPLNVTPTCGAGFLVFGCDMFVGLSRRRTAAHRGPRPVPSRTDRAGCSADGADRAERAAAEILDVVAFHHRRVGVHEEAPVRLIAAEQLLGALAGRGRGSRRREPAMADFLPEHAQRVVLAEEARVGSSGYFARRSMIVKLRETAGAAELAREVEDRPGRCPGPRWRWSTRTRTSLPRRRGIGPDDELIVAVGMVR